MTEALFTRPDPVDWFRLLADLDRAGHCNKAVADACAMPRSTLRHTKEGGQPGHENGEALCLFYIHILHQPIPRLTHVAANAFA